MDSTLSTTDILPFLENKTSLNFYSKSPAISWSNASESQGTSWQKRKKSWKLKLNIFSKK